MFHYSPKVLVKWYPFKVIITFCVNIKVIPGHPSDTHLIYDLILVAMALLKSICPTDFFEILYLIKDLTLGDLISSSPNVIAVD